jgi:hypothetical protein
MRHKKDQIEKKPFVMVRMGRLDDEEGARKFDRAFWQRVGSTGRLTAMWDMLKIYYLLKGRNGDVPRLRRSVTHFQHR